jgi:hypothetical protein
MSKIGVLTRPTQGPAVIADLDTLVALYVELTDRIIPRRDPTIALVLLRYHDEHHWLRGAAAGWRGAGRGPR